MKKFDLIVIGAGGGNKISVPAANLSKQVAIIEKESIGGTCLNRGCIPSKMLIYPADLASMVRESEKFELQMNREIQTDFESLVTRISNTVDQESQSIVPKWEAKPGIHFFNQEARFVSNKVVRVGDEELTADRIVIAVGSRPHTPSIPGLADTPYWTSREALRNTKQPRKLLVLGAGYIACELGHAYGALGTDVHFLVRSRMLRKEDPDVVDEFEQEFSKHHQVHLGQVPENVRFEKDTFYVTCKNAEGQTITHEGDALLVATGVIPNSDLLGLENTDIRLKKSGFIEVDDMLETKVPGIYAIGDVIGHYLFRHSVNFEGDYLFHSLFQTDKPDPIDYPPMPHAVFTHPQIAGVGKTEKECQDEGIAYVVGKNTYKASAMGMARLSDYGFVKVLVAKDSGKLLGAHIIGEEAATMLHQFIYCLTTQGTITDLLNMIYIHPALPEVGRNACRKAWSALNR